MFPSRSLTTGENAGLLRSSVVPVVVRLGDQVVGSPLIDEMYTY